MNHINKNILYNVGSSVAPQLITPIFTILVARILTPDDYGMFAFAMALMLFFAIFKDIGMLELIIIEDRYLLDDLISLIFTIQLFMSIVLITLITSLNDFIESIFAQPDLGFFLIIISSVLISKSFEETMIFYLKRTNQYNIVLKRNLLIPFINGPIALVLANLGYGVNSLFIAFIVSNFLLVLYLYFAIDKKPKLYFDGYLFKELFKKSRHFFIQKIGYFLNDDINKIILTKTLGMHTLGLYNMGKNLGNIIPLTLIPQISEVFYTTVNKDKNNATLVNDLFYKFVFRLTLLSMLYTILVYFLAPLLVPIILTDKWNGIVVILQLVAIYIPLVILGNIFNRLANIYRYYRYYTYSAIILPFIVIPSVIYITSNYDVVILMKFLISLQMLNFAVMYIVFLKENYIIKIDIKLYSLVCFVFIFNILLLGIVK
jgi:teichuronic acid exporter